MNGLKQDERGPERNGNINVLIQALLTQLETSNPKNESERMIKETKIFECVKLAVAADKGLYLMHMMENVVMPYLKTISTAKAAKMVKTLVDMVLGMNGLPWGKPKFLEKWITWAKEERRTYLKLDLEVKLAVVLYGIKKYSDALQTVSSFMETLRRQDDKVLLVKVQLLESRIRYSLSNPTEARAALTSGKTTANGIYCPPSLQAALDMQSGILHADDKDFKTAYSYFVEAFKNYDSIDDARNARKNLQYMMMCEIMLGKADDVLTFFSVKLDTKYQLDLDLLVMKNFAQASVKRSLAEFDKTVKEAKKCLEEDHVIKLHLMTFYDHLLVENLCKILEPFCRVQVQHVANLIHLPIDEVEKKLSQMILDKKIQGVLDQQAGVIILFDETPVDKTYENSLEIIQNLEKVMDALYHKAEKLT